jgi:hypothetical protein
LGAKTPDVGSAHRSHSLSDLLAGGGGRALPRLPDIIRELIGGAWVRSYRWAPGRSYRCRRSDWLCHRGDSRAVAGITPTPAKKAASGTSVPEAEGLKVQRQWIRKLRNRPSCWRCIAPLALHLRRARSSGRDCDAVEDPLRPLRGRKLKNRKSLLMAN